MISKTLSKVMRLGVKCEIVLKLLTVYGLYLCSEFDKRLGLPPGSVVRQIIKGEYNSDGAWQKMERGELLPSEFSAEFSKEMSEAVSIRVQYWSCLYKIYM